ncbi:hypothetical protein [Butyrivibrio proteoclasticus]|uniref:hypothetical protein n=1 Tax=Butyrivibrio proteoclasticus TaxID=43305 RepID=UPI00047B0D8C|nr:hypothetical protein [Butyrivibrio proteoclasticus]
MFYTKKYDNGAGGGSASGDIHIDEEIYDEIVGRIESNNKKTIKDNQTYVEPDAQCLLNPVIPDYQEADHIAVDMFHAMKDETTTVVKLMKQMKEDYVQVDEDKEGELAQQAGQYGG